jgi:hypothetical protein
MRRFLMALTALTVSLNFAAVANAGHGHSSHTSSMSNFKFQSQNNLKMNTQKNQKQFSKTYSKPFGKTYSKTNFYCTHKFWCNDFGCQCYWYPTECCWCFWYEPWNCYVPFRTYVMLVSPVTTTEVELVEPPPPAGAEPAGQE